MLVAAEPVIGIGSHVGTHQSTSFYGSCNTTRVIAAQSPGPNATQTQIDGNSFNALLVNVASARDMVRAAPSVPVQPWVAPKYADWGVGYSYLSSGNSTYTHRFRCCCCCCRCVCVRTSVRVCWYCGHSSPIAFSSNILTEYYAHMHTHAHIRTYMRTHTQGSTDEVMMWEESVFHVALATAATEFLWWQPGSQKPLGLGLDLFSKALAELDWVTGLGQHGGKQSAGAGSGAGAGASGSGCTLEPFQADHTELVNFAGSFILSAMRVSCSDGFRREVYRFTPRCTETVWCTWWNGKPLNGTLSTRWRIGSGFYVTPVQGGTVLVATAPVSTAGAWIIRDL